MIEIEKFKAFVSQSSTRIQNLANRRDTSIGFNAFALASDLYYRENFHSDIICAILNPHSPHGEGVLFVRLFVKFLAKIALLQHKPQLAETLDALPFDDSIEALREDGKVDIKIVHKADPQWTIIVENKINGACDMERQLPRYIENCAARHEKVKAAVYLKASDEGRPEDNGWIKGDKELVDGLLLSVAGYSEDSQICSMVEGWLEPCEARSKNFNAKIVVSQYAELVVNHAGETMNQSEYKQIMDALGQHKVKYSQLAQIVNEMPIALANYIAKEFNRAKTKEKYLLAKDVWIWKDTTVVFDFNKFEIKGKNGMAMPVSYAVDLSCDDLSGWGASFFLRDGIPAKRCESILKEFNSKFAWSDYYKRVVLPFDSDEMFGNPDLLIDKIRELLEFISQNGEKFQNVLNGAV